MQRFLPSLLFERRFCLIQTDNCKSKRKKEILDVTCTQLVRLLNRNFTAYVVENGTLSEGQFFTGETQDTEDLLTAKEQEIARWVYENRQRAGATTHQFPNAKCLYLAIRSGDHVYGCNTEFRCKRNLLIRLNTAF